MLQCKNVKKKEHKTFQNGGPFISFWFKWQCHFYI